MNKGLGSYFEILLRYNAHQIPINSFMALIPLS